MLKEQFILQLTDLKEEFSLVTDPLTVKIEIEDIIPLSICIQATKFYLKEFLQLDETEFCFLTEDLVLKKIANQTILDAIQASLLEFPDKGLQINKVGFARNVIQVVNEWKQKRDSLDKYQSDALQVFEKNFRVLFKKLNIMQRRAQQRLTDERLSQKIERLKKDFIALHPISARREDGVILLDEIEVILENNIDNEAIKEIEAIKNALQNLRRDYKLEIDMSKTIDDYIGFQKGLEIIKYAGLLASQEETPDEPQAKKSATSESEEVPEKVQVVQVDNLVVDEHQQVIIEQVPTTSSEVEIAEVSNNSTKPNQKRKPRIRS